MAAGPLCRLRSRLNKAINKLRVALGDDAEIRVTSKPSLNADTGSFRQWKLRRNFLPGSTLSQCCRCATCQAIPRKIISPTG